MIFSTTFSETFLILRTIQRDVIINTCISSSFNPLKAKLNPICHLLALLGAHPIHHISRIRVKYSTRYSCWILTKLEFSL